MPMSVPHLETKTSNTCLLLQGRIRAEVRKTGEDQDVAALETFGSPSVPDTQYTKHIILRYRFLLNMRFSTRK